MDIYIHRKLLYKCDTSISKIYTNIIKLLTQPHLDPLIKQQTIKQIDLVIFEIFKYKTALLSLQKDIFNNQLTQIKADQQITKSKQEIKSLTEQVKSAEIVRRRKLQFNQVAKTVKQFQTNQQLSQKIKQIQSEVDKLTHQYQLQMETYSEKQRCLKIALSALRVLMKEDGTLNLQQTHLSLP